MTTNSNMIARGIKPRHNKRQTWERTIYGAYYLFVKIDEGILVYKNIYNPEAWEDQWTLVHMFLEEE